MSDQLRSIYARWQNLEADKAAISEDLKELFAEAKGNGYDSKALRIAFRLKASAEGPKAAEVAETASLVETYIAALDGTLIATHAHPRITREQIDLGEAEETRTRLAAAASPGNAPRQSPATHSDDDDMAIPAFMRRTG